MKKRVLLISVALLSSMLALPSCSVNDLLGLSDSAKVEVIGVSISSENDVRTVSEGSILRLNAVVYPETANQEVTWSSSDESVATVSKGVVTGVNLGITTVTATQNGWTVTYKITVTEKVTESSTEESSTDESTTESTTENTTEFTTESTTLPTTTEPVTEPATKDNFFTMVWAEINDENNKVTKLYHYSVMIMAVVIVSAVASVVTYLVTSGYYKAKSKKEDNETLE